MGVSFQRSLRYAINDAKSSRKTENRHLIPPRRNGSFLIEKEAESVN